METKNNRPKHRKKTNLNDGIPNKNNGVGKRWVIDIIENQGLNGRSAYGRVLEIGLLD